MDLFNLVREGNLTALKEQIIYEEINKLRDLKGNSLLLVALNYDQVEIANYLISQGLDLNLANHSGESALFECVKKNKTNLALLLIRAGADVTLKNRKGESIPYFIAYNGNLTLLKALKPLSLTEFITNEGLNVMHGAILGGHLEMVKMIAPAFTDNNLEDKMGNSYLHYAAKSGDLTIVDFFISKKLDINHFNHSFETPLFNAVKLGDLRMCKHLVEKGAYVSLKNKHFATPTDLASIGDLENIKGYFEDYLRNPLVIKKYQDEAVIIAVLNRNYWDLRQLLHTSKDLLLKNQFGLNAFDYAKKYKLKLALDLLEGALKNE